MAGRFVRASKYRHIFGKPTKKEFCYDNIRITRNAWDTNLVKVNPEYLAVNWEASGGGAFAVIPLNERGKLPDQIPLFYGHTAAVLDTDWSPFNDHIIASASDDGKILLWQVPDAFTLYTDGDEVQHVSPVNKLAGHSRKVGQVNWNPSAENILASASGDLTIKLWDVTTGQSQHVLKHADAIQSLSWSANGALLATTARDKKLRVWDVRQEKAVHEFNGHEGAKNSRVVWMGVHNRFATCGFSRMSDRQLALWEPGQPKPIGGFTSLDSISGVCMPFWDDGSNCLYLAGKGDGNIRYFEYENDKFEYLSEYRSAEPQRGIGFMPRRGLNVHENEVMRAYKTVNDQYIEPISFTVPRRSETFQSDIFPPAIGPRPAMSAKEWLDGKTGVPPKIDLESVFEGTAPVEIPADFKPAAVPAPAPAPAAKHAATKEPEPKPAVARAPPPRTTDQRFSPMAMVDKYRDDVDDDDDDDEEPENPSSFDEPSQSGQRSAIGKAPESPVKTSAPSFQPKPASAARAHVSSVSSPAASSPSSVAVESSLDQIKQLLEQTNKIIATQSEQISVLTAKVGALEKTASLGAQGQSERIRQLELELESARS